jgi:hypothetical protein
MPGNAALSIDKTRYNILTRATFHPSHSARPAQTPAMTRLLDLVSLFLFIVFSILDIIVSEFCCFYNFIVNAKIIIVSLKFSKLLFRIEEYKKILSYFLSPADAQKEEENRYIIIIMLKKVRLIIF